MKKTLSAICILASAILFLPSAEAAVIYDNGGPSYVEGYVSDFGGTLQRGDDFTLNAGADVITDIHWWGFYYGGSNQGVPPNDTFTIRIFDIVSGVPAINPLFAFTPTVGVVTRTDTGNTLGNEGFEYLFVLPQAIDSLASGTPYLLSIINDSRSSGGGGYAYWQWSTSQAGASFYRFNDGDAWATTGQLDFAFNLTGPDAPPIPEPGTMMLLGSGLAGLVGYGRRRFKK